jgi:hypothetical protein
MGMMSPTSAATTTATHTHTQIKQNHKFTSSVTSQDAKVDL